MNFSSKGYLQTILISVCTTLVILIVWTVISKEKLGTIRYETSPVAEENRVMDVQPTVVEPEVVNPQEEGDIYTNHELGFQLTFPDGWLLPTEDDQDPHGYFCPGTPCKTPPEMVKPPVKAWEILRDQYKTTSEVWDELRALQLQPYEISDVIIPGAVVLGSAVEPMGDSWPHQYVLIFKDLQRVYTVFVSDPPYNDEVMWNILRTFKPL